MAMKTVYLAGPMRGYKLYNFPAFDAAAERLRDLGYRVLSPADIDRENGFDPILNPESQWGSPEQVETVVRRDIDAIIKSEGVVLLEGWEKSTGATAEVKVAAWLGRPVYEMGDFITRHFIKQEQYA